MDQSLCAVTECDQSRRKRQWCNRHYQVWRRTGDASTPPRWTWGDRAVCVVCGASTVGRRKVCSDSCAARSVKHGGARPAGATCQRCGAQFSLTERTRQGHLRRADARLCGDCRRARYTRHHMSVSVLAQRDGTDCKLCGRPVDLLLRYPDRQRASVDHVVPFSRGGSHDPANLQLAHLQCNSIKSDRVGV